MPQESMDRRTFLKVGSLGTAMAMTGVGSAQEAAVSATVPVRRTLGRTGLKVTIVGFGALNTSEPAIYQAAFDRGVNWVDTGRVYMDGRNERIVGDALKGYRDKVYVSTKAVPASVEEMETSVKESLAALGVEYVDLLQLHHLKTKDEVFNKEYRDFFVRMRQEGKTKFIGVTSHSNEVEVLDAVASDPEKLWDTVMLPYNFKSPPATKAAIERAAKAGVGIIAMKTQAGGYATKELGEISPHQAALKYVLRDPNVSFAVPGMTNLKQVEEGVAVMGMQVTRADLDILNRYGKAIAPYYCHRCDVCRPTCPMGVAVSEINRSLMYAEGYREPALAHSTYHGIAPTISAAACGDCAVCTARCPNGINIAERIQRARVLFS